MCAIWLWMVHLGGVLRENHYVQKNQIWFDWRWTIHNLTILTFGHVLYMMMNHICIIFSIIWGSILKRSYHVLPRTICYQFDNPTKRHQISNYGGDQIPEKSVLDY